MTRRGERTRERFRAGARVMIARKGFLRTTIGDIAVAAERSPASFYNYYDSKEALLAELTDELPTDPFGQQPVVVEPGAPLYPVVRAAAAAYWETYRTHLAELVGVFQVAMVDERFAQRWRDIRVARVETIRQGIARAQAAGFCPGIDPWLTAGALGSMFEHFCYVTLAQGGAFSPGTVDEEAAIDTIASVWFHAVYWTVDTRPNPTSGPATVRAAGASPP